MEIINPAIPAAVRVTGTNLNIESIMSTYIVKASTAITPGNLYQMIRKSAIARNPISAALTPAEVACSPNDGPIVCVEMRLIGTGSAPEFKRPTRSLASVGVKFPVIWALPPVIASFTVGIEIGAPSRNIATRLPIFSFVIFSNNVAPSALNCNDTTGSPVV